MPVLSLCTTCADSTRGIVLPVLGCSESQQFLQSPHPSSGLKAMRETQVLAVLCPVSASCSPRALMGGGLGMLIPSFGELFCRHVWHQPSSSLPCPCLSCAFYMMFSWSQHSAKPPALDICGSFGPLRSFHFSVQQQLQRFALKSTSCKTNTCVAPSLNASCVSQAEFESTLESTFTTIHTQQQQGSCHDVPEKCFLLTWSQPISEEPPDRLETCWSIPT